MSEHKEYCKFFDEVYSQDNPQEDAYGWIQWKGTNVCLDATCVCGASGHIDGSFAYYFRCIECGRRYALGPTIKLIELTDEQAAYAATRHKFYVDESSEGGAE